MKNIAVFFGGQSIEHDVSVITGVLTLNTIDKTKFNAIGVYIDSDGKFYIGKDLCDIDNFSKLNMKKLTQVTFVLGDNGLYKIKNKKTQKLLSISAAINCLHGERGEDGCLSSLMKMCGIALCSPDLLSASISMDKTITKYILKGLRINCLPYITVRKNQSVNEKIIKFSYPVIVKPATGGSSIGINVANDFNQMKGALANAFQFGEYVIIEPLLSNFVEINCAAYKNSKGEIIVSSCERPVGRTEILCFNDKYKDGKREFPANIENKFSDKIQRITKEIYERLMFNGIVRIDFFIKNEKVYVNEINSVPGSLAYYLFSDTLKGFSEILTDIIEKSLKDFAQSLTQKRIYNSGILMDVGSKGAKHLKKKI